MTKKQQKDLETIIYFVPRLMGVKRFTDIQIKAFFDYSDNGIAPDKKIARQIGYMKLIQGKRWRGIHVGMYEDGVLDGSMPYCVIFEDQPDCVIDFMSKEMFKGSDLELIQAARSVL